MDPIYIVHNTQKNAKYTYVSTEQEAKNYIREKAEEMRVRLSADPLLKVYTTSDGNRDIKVLVQQVGSMWNGFLEEKVSFNYFPVHHISHEPTSETLDSKEDYEDYEDYEDGRIIAEKTQGF